MKKILALTALCLFASPVFAQKPAPPITIENAYAFATAPMQTSGAAFMTMPKSALIRNLVMNHWYHHRGQLSVYLRLLDTPGLSIYGPSADENPFA